MILDGPRAVNGFLLVAVLIIPNIRVTQMGRCWTLVVFTTQSDGDIMELTRHHYARAQSACSHIGETASQELEENEP